MSPRPRDERERDGGATEGHETPIIFLPGHLCDARIFAPQAEALRLSAPRMAETRLDADIAAMADRLLAAAPERFAVIGFSMGGMLATELIGRAPERLAGAAIIAGDAGAPRPKEIAWRAEQAAAARAQGRAGFDAFAAAFLDRFFTHAPDAQTRFGPALRAMTADVEIEVFLRQAAVLSSRQDRYEALSRYDEAERGALLFLCGAEDRLCPPLLSERMKDAAPGGGLEIIPDCGHLATLEHPEAVNRALLAWRTDLR